MEEFIIVNLNLKLDKEIILKASRKYSRQIIIALSVITVLAIIYIIFSANENSIAVSDKKQTESNLVVDKKADDKLKKVLYTVEKNTNELKNPFTFAHETEAISIVNIENNTNKTNNTNNEQIPINMIDEQSNNITNNDDEVKNKQNKNEADKYKLTAIMQINKQKIALIKTDKQSFRVQEGDIINNAVVNSIGTNNLVLQMPDGIMQVYQLKGF